MLHEILSTENVVESINDNLTILLEIIPEINYMIGFEHKHPHHHLDVWNHTLLALSMSENDFDIRLSLLLHDIGKPFSYQEDGDIRHFMNHPKKSEEISREILGRLNYDEEYINKICFYIRNHDTPISENLIYNSKEDAIKLLKIQKCDALAHHPDKLDKRKKYIESMNKKLSRIK